jgi:hypothetical protein
MKRFLVAAVILLSSLGLWLLPTLIRLYRAVERAEASGIGFVVGSVGENVLRLIVLLLLAALAWWISGKLLAA